MIKFKCLKCGDYITVKESILQCQCGNTDKWEKMFNKLCQCGKPISEDNFYCSVECFHKYHKEEVKG